MSKRYCIVVTRGRFGIEVAFLLGSGRSVINSSVSLHSFESTSIFIPLLRLSDFFVSLLHSLS